MPDATPSKVFRWLLTTACVLPILIGSPLWAQERDMIFGDSQDEEKTTQPAAQQTPSESTALAADQPEIKPRLELYVPSLSKLMAEARRSHSGALVSTLGGMLLEMGSASSEGVDVDQATGILQLITDWPDTAVNAAIYAHDTEGRLRWLVRLDWPLEDLHARARQILSSEAGETIFEGVTLEPGSPTAKAMGHPIGGYELALGESSLACLLPAGDSATYIASHPDLTLPSRPFTGSPQTAGEQPPLLVARLNLASTEKDSGATFFSRFRFFSGVEYACRVNSDGDWDETVHMYWPPAAGIVAKAVLGRVKQTFFVPGEAFGAVVVKPMGAAGILEGLAGFGPQMMVEASGEFAMVGEVQRGPIARRGGSDICITLLPGTGFLPVPDVVAQIRVKKVDRFIEEVRQATEKINELHRDRDRPEPWTETQVHDRPVFWSEGTRSFPGAMMPFVMRPVVFTTREIDAKDRERDFLVVGLTSTSPERFVRRWLELPRNKQKRFLPSTTKTNGQAWINWKQAYKWIHPYINLALSAVIRDTLLPSNEELASDMGDATAQLKIGYDGCHATHQGPIPAGTLVLPAMFAFSTMEDQSGGSDLARERLAARRLKVLHHHCRLFKKDHHRWPAELAELDGYIDFAGHPELLKLRLSSSKRWKSFFGDLLESDDEQEEDDEDALVDIDDELFVIQWGRDDWSLGLAPDTLEHLDNLYIDQDGKIHRVEKEEPKEPPGEQPTKESDS